MKKSLIIFLTALCSLSFVRCSDFLDVSSPSQLGDEFVTSTPDEAFKILSSVYGQLAQNNIFFNGYGWNDPVGSDAEHYPESGTGSGNNINAAMRVDEYTTETAAGGFNNAYAAIGYAARLAGIIAKNSDYQADKAAGVTSDWTQLYGEAVTMRALIYFRLVQSFGDIPYGYENTAAEGYKLSSRFDIYDDLIAQLIEVEPLMYKLGEGGITGERLSRTLNNALIGKIAVEAAGYQTIRTDVEGLYGELSFTDKATANGYSYSRRNDYADYLTIAETWLAKAMGENAGSGHIITTDERPDIDNPFQRHFQYAMDFEISPETLFEIGQKQGNGVDGMGVNCEILYGFGRAATGGNGTQPPKVFSASRMNPVFYYDWDPADKRRDVSGSVTGLNKGDEVLLLLNCGNGKNSADGGGITLNKWDYCHMSEMYTEKQRLSGINYPIMRMGEAVLLLAEAKAGLNKDGEALSLLNQLRSRAGVSQLTGLSGDDVKKAVVKEAHLELFGEGPVRRFMMRAGTFSEDIAAMHERMKEVAEAIKSSQGYATFENGNKFPAYIYTKKMGGAQVTYEAVDGDPVLSPGWRGVWDWNLGGDHNLGIKGLFADPAETESALLADGWEKVAWGADFADHIDEYVWSCVGGIKSANDVPMIFFPIPLETLNHSNGNVTNGYGLPNR